MAIEIRQYTATIPAGTTAAAPYTKDMSFPPREVESITVVVPPGSSGNVGFALASKGQRIIPADSDLWIITAGEIINWPLTDQHNSGSWQLIGYNTGTVGHLVFVRFACGIASRAVPVIAASTMIDDTALTSGNWGDSG